MLSASSSTTGGCEEQIFNNTVYGNGSRRESIFNNTIYATADRESRLPEGNPRQRGPQQHRDRQPRPEPVQSVSKTTVADHNMIQGNPLFRDPKANDFHLQAGLPGHRRRRRDSGGPQRPRRHSAAPGQGLRSRGLRVQRRFVRAHDRPVFRRLRSRSDVSRRHRVHEEAQVGWDQSQPVTWVRSGLTAARGRTSRCLPV